MLEIGRRLEFRSKSRFELGWYNAQTNSGIAPSMVPHSKKRIPRLPCPLNNNPYGRRQCTHHSIPYDAMRTRVASPDQNHSLPGPDQKRKEPDVETFWNVTENGSTWKRYPSMGRAWKRFLLLPFRIPAFGLKTPPPVKRYPNAYRGNVFTCEVPQ